MARRWFRFPAWLALVMLVPAALVMLVPAALGAALAAVLPAGPHPVGVGVAGHLLTWDAVWYRDIALHGFSWNKRFGTFPGHDQNVAFFPLYGLVDWLTVRLAGPGPLGLLLVGFGWALASAAGCYALARALLPDATAGWATALYALWPGSCFFLMGYPTGLINLLVMLTLLCHVKGHRLLAAWWCGLGTAAAPTMVFVAAAVTLEAALRWYRDGMTGNGLLRLLLVGAASVSGLLCFMLYLSVKFGAPLAFVAAQASFTSTPALPAHVMRLLNPLWYLAVFPMAYQMTISIVRHGLPAGAAGRGAVDWVFQLMIDFLAILLLAAGLIRCMMMRLPRIVWSSGWFVLAGYLWFVATSSLNLASGIRLLYPAAGMFLGLADWGAATVPVRGLLVAAFAATAGLEVALAATGYTVI